MSSSSIDHGIVGRLQADYSITRSDTPVVDQLGGSAVYSAVGAGIWSRAVGLVSRIGTNFRRDWIGALAEHGFDTDGVRSAESEQEHRRFFAYRPSEDSVVHSDPASQFARIGHRLPAQLRDYDEHRALDSPSQFGPLAARPDELPPAYQRARAMHVAPCDFVTHRTMPAAARALGIRTITCDPDERYMQASYQAEVRLIVSGLDAFLPSEAKTTNFFRTEVDDMWEAAEGFAAMGAAIVVIKRGAHGQYVFDAGARTRWHVPAYPTRVADVTGAGDAYGGGFLVGLADTGDAVEAALRGSISASLVIESRDPFYALNAHPHLAEARLGAHRELVRKI